MSQSEDEEKIKKYIDNKSVDDKSVDKLITLMESVSFPKIDIISILRLPIDVDVKFDIVNARIYKQIEVIANSFKLEKIEDITSKFPKIERDGGEKKRKKRKM